MLTTRTGDIVRVDDVFPYTWIGPTPIYGESYRLSYTLYDPDGVFVGTAKHNYTAGATDRYPYDQGEIMCRIDPPTPRLNIGKALRLHNTLQGELGI